MTQEIQSIVEALTFNNRLWSMQDVAVYLNRSYNTVMNQISKLPDFPPAVRLSGTKDKPLYDPKDIKKWVDSKKEKH